VNKQIDLLADIMMVHGRREPLVLSGTQKQLETTTDGIPSGCMAGDSPKTIRGPWSSLRTDQSHPLILECTSCHLHGV
jgi:hypothetical protein